MRDGSTEFSDSMEFDAAGLGRLDLCAVLLSRVIDKVNIIFRL